MGAASCPTPSCCPERVGWRADSLAGLAVEEVGKAGSLATLAAMPESLRARAPVRRMLKWHQMKLVAGQLIAAVPLGAPTLATRFVTMPLSEVAELFGGGGHPPVLLAALSSSPAEDGGQGGLAKQLAASSLAIAGVSRH
jgi:hypothetical protein